MVSPTLLSSKAQDWRTPLTLFHAIEALDPSRPFTLDAASQSGHELHPLFIGPGSFYRSDALNGGVWTDDDRRTFLNPPYGRELATFIEEAIKQICLTPSRDIWLLVPARVDTRWWNRLVARAFGVWFVKGRIRFVLPDGTEADAAPFPSAIVAIDGLRHRRRGPFVEWEWEWKSTA